ncbi:NOB1 family endonuclease [Halocalculus aciditolerans]|uniref:DNA-binding protein n=1 Tax=Halocalculus aciditolerans TaxID=1383812 RepID=A0A830FFD8_9EURY|nr:NOB1 family endonuclease [Halocalculus aciditolerans]GGL47806.1 DNA-binding protein [Halocalculus aciditolerans]
MYVLDASAFIDEYEPNGPTASIPGVREELESAAQYRFDAREGQGMHVVVPDADAVTEVERAARVTGDLDELSDVDVRVLAAAVELDATLVTDDYAMQNVADELGLAVDVVAKSGISERRDWVFQCAGCGRTFDDKKDRCPICGSSLSRKNPS